MYLASLTPAPPSKEPTFSEFWGEAVCARISCGEAVIKVIADITRTRIGMENLVIGASIINTNLEERQRLQQRFNKLD